METDTMVHALADRLANMTGVRFVSLVYTATTGRITPETSRYVVNVGASLTNAYEKDVEILRALLTTDLSEIDRQAATEILASRELSLSVGIGNHPNATTQNIQHVAERGRLDYLPATGTLSILGLEVSRTVLVPGEFKPVNSKPLTLAKRRIEKDLPTSRIRRFNLPNVTRARLNGETLEILPE
jgi:hypothetical protein